MGSDRYDVVVSGAGPAGAMAASRCACAGLRTALVERWEVPRQKCCAGGVLERSLRQLGTPLPDALIEREIFGAALVHGDIRHEYRSPSRLGVTVRRDRFDEFLARGAEKTGAELITKFRTERVRDEGDKLTVESEEGKALHAKYLIIAEGANSRTARQALGPYSPDGLAIGLAAECDFGTAPEDLIEFYLFKEGGFKMPFVTPGGMDGWLFPHAQGGNVGVGAYKAGTTDIRRQMDRMVQEAGRTYGGAEIKGEISAHPIPVRPREQFSSGRCLVAGDAAGLASALSGEGISYSLTSGVLAAEAVQSAMAKGHRDGILLSYDRSIRSEVLPVLRAAKWASIWFQHMTNIIDLDRFLRNMQNDKSIVGASIAMSRAEKDWTFLLRKAVVRFPVQFFSAVG